VSVSRRLFAPMQACEPRESRCIACVRLMWHKSPFIQKVLPGCFISSAGAPLVGYYVRFRTTRLCLDK